MARPQAVRATLAARIRTEIDLGFPLMGKVPQTGIVQVMDYIGGLPEAPREAFVEALATRAEAQLVPTGGTLPWPDAWQRFYGISRGVGQLGSGLRYRQIRSFAPLPGSLQPASSDTSGGGQSGSDAPPRADLLPDPASCVPAKAALLKSLVKSALTPLGYVAHRLAGGGLRYLSPRGTLVDLDFGSKAAQLRYGVAVHAQDKVTAPLTRVRFTSAEAILFSTEAAWDYLTEENAARCIAHLPALIDEVSALLDSYR
jgi:hypothetical protein